MIITYIHWKDASFEEAPNANTPLSAEPLADLREVGWLINETEDSVSISMELEEDDSPARWRAHIPKVNIIERRDMEVDKAFPVKKRRKT